MAEPIERRKITAFMAFLPALFLLPFTADRRRVTVLEQDKDGVFREIEATVIGKTILLADGTTYSMEKGRA